MGKQPRNCEILTEDIVRKVAIPLGFVDVKVCAVDEVWSGLKLVVRRSFVEMCPSMLTGMGPDAFRRIALGMEGAVEGAHMGHPDFRVKRRIFATLHHDQRFGMVALTPDQQQKFIRDDPETFAPEAGAWGRSGSTSVRLASVDEDTLGEALTLAWQNTATKNPVGPSRVKRSAKAIRSSRKQ